MPQSTSFSTQNSTAVTRSWSVSGLLSMVPFKLAINAERSMIFVQGTALTLRKAIAKNLAWAQRVGAAARQQALNFVQGTTLSFVRVRSLLMLFVQGQVNRLVKAVTTSWNVIAQGIPPFNQPGQAQIPFFTITAVVQHAFFITLTLLQSAALRPSKQVVATARTWVQAQVAIRTTDATKLMRSFTAPQTAKLNIGVFYQQLLTMAQNGVITVVKSVVLVPRLFTQAGNYVTHKAISIVREIGQNFQSVSMTVLGITHQATILVANAQVYVRSLAITNTRAWVNASAIVTTRATSLATRAFAVPTTMVRSLSIVKSIAWSESTIFSLPHRAITALRVWAVNTTITMQLFLSRLFEFIAVAQSQVARFNRGRKLSLSFTVHPVLTTAIRRIRHRITKIIAWMDVGK